MSTQRKRVMFNEQIKLNHERKEWVEENRRIERMEYEACMGIVQKQKRSKFLALAAGLRIANMQMELVV